MIDKLAEHDKAKVLHIIAEYAFQDYARSAASKRACPDCDDGFIEVEVFTTKCHGRKQPSGYSKCQTSSKNNTHQINLLFREVREITRVICPTCKR